MKNKRTEFQFIVLYANDETQWTWRFFKTFGGAYRYIKNNHYSQHWSRTPKPYWAIERVRWYTDENGKLRIDRNSAILAQSRDYPHKTHFRRRWLEGAE